MKKKPRRLLKPGFCIDMKTGQINEVLNITKSTLDRIEADLNRMHKIIKSCSRWNHSPALDRRIAEHLKSMKGDQP